MSGGTGDTPFAPRGPQASSTPGGDGSAREVVPEAIVEALLNRELDEGSRERVFSMLRTNPRQCEDLARTQRIVSMLRRPVEGPDVSAAIMERVSAKRGFLPERLRRAVSRGRLAVGACGLLVLLGAAVVQRLAPELTELTPGPRPVSAVLKAGKADAAAGAERLVSAIGALRTKVSEPVAEISRTVAVEARFSMDRMQRPLTLTVTESARDEAPQRVYLVEPLTPGPVTTVRLLGTGGEGSPMATVVCSGAADTTAFPAPASVLGECRAAVLLPVSGASVCRQGSGVSQASWVRVGPGAAFLLPPPRNLTYIVSSFARDTAGESATAGLRREP